MKDKRIENQGTNMIRSFVGIPLTGHELVTGISRISRELGAIRGIKGVRTENLHITLKFLGDIDTGDEMSSIIDGLTLVAKQHTGFKVKFNGTGTFPNIDRMRVIWIGIESQGLGDLAKDVLRTLPVKDGERLQKFKPHLTIGRVKFPDGSGRAKKLVSSRKDHDFGIMNVKGFELMKSTLTPSGPIYEAIKHFPLPDEKSEG